MLHIVQVERLVDLQEWSVRGVFRAVCKFEVALKGITRFLVYLSHRVFRGFALPMLRFHELYCYKAFASEFSTFGHRRLCYK